MKKILLATLFTFMFKGFIFAQQDPQFSHYHFNKLSFNPAYAGIRRAICFNSLFREQWTGFPGNPRNVLFSADAYVSSVGGLGLTLINDQLGFDKTNIAKLAYSFHLPNVGLGTLAFGVEGGMIQKALGKDWIYIDDNDPSIPLNGISNTTWDLGLGAYYEIEDRLFFGISTLHIPQNSLGNNGTLFYQTQTHYYLTAGHEFFVSALNVVIKNSLLAKSDAASTQIDFNSIVVWQRKIWAGVSYRLTDAFVVMAGMQHLIDRNTLKIGYSYDITTSAIKHYSSGTHELFVSYCIPLSDKPKRTVWDNVRYMHGGSQF